MNEREGTDFFPYPYKVGRKYCFMRNSYKVNLVYNYISKLYSHPYERDSEGSLVPCNGKYEVEEFSRLLNAHKIILLYGDYPQLEDNELKELPF